MNASNTLAKTELDRQKIFSTLASSNAKMRSEAQAVAEAQILLTQDVDTKTDTLTNHSVSIAQILRGEGETLAELKDQTVMNGIILQSTSKVVRLLMAGVGKIQTTTTSILGLAIEVLNIVTAGLAKMNEITVQVSRLTELAGAMTTEMRQAVVEHLRVYGNIQRMLSRIEASFSYQIYQQPQIWFRDAFNVRRPFLWELSREWMKFKGLVTVVFMDQQGLHRVLRDQFYITHTRTGRVLSPQYWRNTIEPGDELSMTMIIDDYEVEEGLCPYKSCRADTSEVEVVQGRKNCPKCDRYAALANEDKESASENDDDKSVRGSRASSQRGNKTKQDEGKRKADNMDSWSSNGPLIAVPEVEDAIFEDIEKYVSIQVTKLLSNDESSGWDWKPSTSTRTGAQP